MRSVAWLALILALCGANARAEEPVFVARTSAGKEFTGPLARLDADWAIEIGKGARRKIPSGELIELRQQEVTPPELPGDEHLILATGDRVPFTSLRLEDEKLMVEHPDLEGGKSVAVPLASVLLIWGMGPDRATAPESVRRSLLRGKRPRDVVLLRNGDRVEGTLNSIGQEVEVEVNKKPVKVKWPQVAAIALSTELAEKPKMPALAGRLVLTGTNKSAGARLTVVSPSLVMGELRAKTTFGAIVRVPLERVASIEVVGGKSVDLSSMKVAKYEYRPFLDERWAYAVDANVMGRDLRVGGVAYERGIGMHAASALSYDLDGKYSRFEALVGLDDLDGRRGRVTIRVLVDGKEVDVGKKGTLTRQNGPWRIEAKVEGAKTLTLEVNAADEGPVQAVVNWVQARLVQ